MNHSARRINALAAPLGARRYLEIGLSRGLTFADVAIEERLGVDPVLGGAVQQLAGPTARLFAMTSDAFFASEPQEPPYDIVFIDGLHVFEQVVRDFSNALLHTHPRAALLLDDVMPNDVFSALPDEAAARRHRKRAGGVGVSWHGDVFKLVFMIHDFWPGLNYRTIVGSGNPQTLVWRSASGARAPLFNNLERISRLTYFDLHDNLDVMRSTSEDEAIDLCLRELGAR